MILCENCGNKMPERVGNNNSRRYPPHCMKPECRRVYKNLRERERKERKALERPMPYFKVPEQYDKVKFNALGVAVKPDPFKKLVDGRNRQCATCPYVDNCRQRVNLGLHVMCESASKSEREYIEGNPELLYNLRILSVVE